MTTYPYIKKKGSKNLPFNTYMDFFKPIHLTKNIQKTTIFKNIRFLTSLPSNVEKHFLKQLFSFS